ncbi:MAG: hypothetical protein HFI93_06610 [Lachnospiraceae bacterium]|nr:hypothetical protein [Lachnospiraceae bacterium]
MSVLFSFLIGLAVNLDNFLIGMSLGLKRQSLPFSSNFLISLTSGLFAYFPARLTKVIFINYLPAAQTAGAILMILYGLFCLCQACREMAFRTQVPPAAPVSNRQALALGVLLAINCVPPAISAGTFSFSPEATALFCCAFSFLSLWLGNRMGGQFAQKKGIRFLPYFAALLLILIGGIQLLF